MKCVQNLLLGDPVYDERGQLVRREYGLKNALALFVLGYIAYTLYLSMGKKVFSGKRKGKMKGGKFPGSVIFSLLSVGCCFILVACLIVATSENQEWKRPPLLIVTILCFVIGAALFIFSGILNSKFN